MPPMSLAPMEKTVSKFGGPSAWKGKELTQNKWWGLELSRDELDEIDVAFAHAQKAGLVFDGDVPLNLTKSTFPLVKLAARIAEMADELENGIGCTMIANMPVHKYTEQELGVIYMGFCSYLGNLVPQSSAGLRSKSRGYGMLLGQVRAEMHGNTPLGGKQANNYFRLHTDRCDMLSLLSVRTAQAGGRSRAASAVTIHDTMLERYPHLAPLLYKPIPRIWEGGSGISNLPVWAVHEGKFTTQISPSYVENAQFVPGVRKLSEEELEALDLLEEIGLEVGHDYLQEPGQMIFVNNHVTYHGRTAWKYAGDSLDAKQGRLLLRTWIAPYNSRNLPASPEYVELWGDVRGGAVRGGLEPAEKAGIAEKPKELVDAIASGSYNYYGLYKRKFDGQSVAEYEK